MIKVTLGDKPVQESKPFPKLMIAEASQCIALFYDKGSGICIDPGATGNDPYSYSDKWTMSAFTDYNEPITIQNA